LVEPDVDKCYSPINNALILPQSHCIYRLWEISQLITSSLLYTINWDWRNYTFKFRHKIRFKH